MQVQIHMPRGIPASESKSSWYSKTKSYEWSELFEAGVQGPDRALEAFGFLMLKYATYNILETLFSLIFDS